MNYSVKQLAHITNSEVFGDDSLFVKTIAFDSRSIYSLEDTAFIALNTDKNSGEKYIQDVIHKGIKIIITEHLPSTLQQDVSYLKVKNTLEFLQLISKHHIERFPKLKTIGITGSNGKTILKEWLYQSLRDEVNVVKSPKSFNSQIGLPLSLLEANTKHNVGIFEVGISKPNEMNKLAAIFQPHIGVLTHIGSAHSSNFDSEDQLIDEKLQLFKNSDTIIFNGDNELTVSKVKNQYTNKHLISFGLKHTNDVYISSDWHDRSIDIQIHYFNESFTLPVSKRDEATLSNALALICVLKQLNFSNEVIIDKINRLKAVEMRLESIKGIKNNLIINDSFNLDLDSLRIAYQFIHEYQKDQKTLVLTDFVETKNSKELYDEVIKLTNEQRFHQIFLVGKEITQRFNEFNSPTFTFNKVEELLQSPFFYQLENQLILLKGARKFEIEKVKNFLELQKHDTVLEVNLNALLNNINIHKAYLKPETKMMAMVKANSYGLGSYEISEFLQHHHIDYLGVAFADEGAELRKKGVTTPIIVMNPEQHSYDTVIEYQLEPEIYSFRVLQLFSQQLRSKGFDGQYPIHIKLETGMHRLGFKDFELKDLAERIKGFGNIIVKSIFSHLSTADVPSEEAYALQQLHNFTNMSEVLIKKLGYQPIRHILNSAGITNFTQYQFDMVRIGIGMMGISTNPTVSKKLQNVVSFKTVISQISEVKAGETIGYSRKHKVDHTTKIATIPVGYADGIPRLVGNSRGHVIIDNKKYPIVGNVCMDMCMVDIGNANIKEGDEVAIFNSLKTWLEFSDECQTIPYEVLTSISHRVKRIYIKN